jgi:hypothetical protein
LPRLLLIAASVCAAFGGSVNQDPAQGTVPGKATGTPAQPAAAQWQPMFDGKSLKGWKEAEFPGAGEVRVSDGAIVLGRSYMTGVNWTAPFPKSDYEIRYEAARVQGGEFFAALTFPVNDSFCTLINGGWGGMLVGLSSLDGRDASENETTQSWDFVTGQWYEFRLVVNRDRIRVWIDGKAVIDVNIANRDVSLRPGEIELSTPLGFASYSTVGAIRKVEYRPLPPAPAQKPQ